MTRIRSLTVAAIASAAAVGLMAVPADAVVAPRPPHIVAMPDNVMVNTDTVLVGSNFPPNRTLTVAECSTKQWFVPEHPCATSNVIRVHTSANGHFRHAMTATVCPSIQAGGPPGFSQLCYVGVPMLTGVDGVTLLGAAPLVVTGP